MSLLHHVIPDLIRDDVVEKILPIATLQEEGTPYGCWRGSDRPNLPLAKFLIPAG